MASLTPEQQAIRHQLNNFRAVLPDPNTDLNSLLLLFMLDELRLTRSMLNELLSLLQKDGLQDGILSIKPDQDDSDKKSEL